jgi:hypothetical protein
MPNELAKLPTMLADTRKLPDGGASMDETHRPAAIMASKQIRTDLAMSGIKLNARLLNARNLFRPQEHEGGWSLNTRTGLAYWAEDHTRAVVVQRSPIEVADVVRVTGRAPPVASIQTR